MSSQFLSKLSQNYIELLEDNEYYDITIEAGEDPNDNVLAHIKLPNISPETFQIILKYIYGVKGTEEILGGYNPVKWESSGWVDTEYAFQNHTILGPYFGSDIIIMNASTESADYNNIRCRKYYYEKKIRDTEEQFSIEDYEVYQITRR
ncbi:BTB/POZ protein [Rhizophagus irregularis DAOM 181602=DAOM 197198]|nr:BTB/POZ protein [Rhizophagus irregularis DAOM 181602=DAOM 197198]